jgi:hypothetical protein
MANYLDGVDGGKHSSNNTIAVSKPTFAVSVEFTDNKNKLNNEILTFVFNPKTNEVIGCNLPLHSDEFNKTLYDKNGKSQEYGWGGQMNDNNESIKFNSIDDAQKWHSDRTMKHLLKQTKNDSYPDLSNIALQLRNLKEINYQIINKGSCFKFAKEISKLGYNNFTFIFSAEEQEVIHVYIKLSNNLFWDATGFHKKSEIKSDYYIGNENAMYDGNVEELDNYCEINTYNSLTTIPISDDIWKKIVRIIKFNKK